MLDIVEELKSLLAELDGSHIDYALCGGLAMGVYGHTRATIDIDLLVLSESLDKVIEIAGTQGYNIREKDMSLRKAQSKYAVFPRLILRTATYYR